MKVILVGGGRPLYFLAQTFLGKGHSLTIINRNPDECERLARELEDAIIVKGDGSDRRILDEAGARGADVIIAATRSDPDNLIACHLARARFEVPRAVALVNDPENQSIFRELGIDAIWTSQTIASLIEQRTALDLVTNLIPAAEGKVTISEVTLSADSPVLGRSLAQIEDFPKDALIAVVTRDGEPLIPKGVTELRENDRVLLVTLSGIHAHALKLLTGK
jgi:trk system potassium uptake protein TrkA